MNQKELANRLRQNPDALQSVLRSPDGSVCCSCSPAATAARRSSRPRSRLNPAARRSSRSFCAASCPRPTARRSPGASCSSCSSNRSGRAQACRNWTKNSISCSAIPPPWRRSCSWPNSSPARSVRAVGAALRRPHRPPAPAPPPEPAAPPPGTNPLGAFDPQLLTRMLPLMQSLTQTSGPTQQLLTALRPFLREEKQEKLQRAAQLAKLIHLGKQFLTEWGGGLV